MANAAQLASQCDIMFSQLPIEAASHISLVTQSWGNVLFSQNMPVIPPMSFVYSDISEARIKEAGYIF